MANQLIHQVRPAGLGQIPAATFESGAAVGFQNLAKVFDGIADRLADREDKAAERAGAKAGALAGAAGTFERRDDETIRGEAFNIAATTTFQQTTSAKVKVRLAEFEREFADNSAGYSNAVKAYSAGVTAEVEKVSPEIAGIFAQELELRRGQGEARIFKKEQSNQTDAARAAALLSLRSISEDAAEAGRNVDFDDPNSVTEYFAGLDKRRAEFRASMMGTGPLGPLFTEEQRTAAMLAFEDDETETAIMGRFGNLLETDDEAALEALDAFEGGDEVKIEVIDPETGEKTTRTIALRDDLRTRIAQRMRSAVRARRAEAAFQRATEDRERKKRQAEADALLDLAVSRNLAREPDVEEAFGRGDITVSQRVARLQQIDRRDAALAKQQGQVESVAAVLAARLKRVGDAGALGFFDPAVKEDREAVDAYYEEVVAPAILAGDPNAATSAISDYIDRVGIVPTEVKSTITAALRQGPAGDREGAEAIVQAKVAAADMLGRLAIGTPTVMNEFTTDEKDLGIGIQTLVRAGVAPADAVRRTEELLAVPKPERKLLEQIARDEDHFESNQTFVDKTFQTGGTFLFGFGSPGTVAGIAFRAEFNEIQRRAFLRTRDLQMSQNIAATDMRLVWAPSAVGNGAASDEPRLMKYAPERFGNFPEAGDNTEWMREQFVADILSLNPLRAADAAPVEEQYRIVADSVTAREASAKQVPSYAIMFIGNGSPEPVRDADGDLARWTPDWSKSRQFKEAKKAQKEAVEEARAARDVNTDINAEVRRTLDSIKGLRDALGVNRDGADVGAVD